MPVSAASIHYCKRVLFRLSVPQRTASMGTRMDRSLSS